MTHGSLWIRTSCSSPVTRGCSDTSQWRLGVEFPSRHAGQRGAQLAGPSVLASGRTPSASLRPGCMASWLPLGPSASSLGAWDRESSGLGLQAEKKKQNENTELSLHRTLASACPPHTHPVLSALALWYLAKPPPPPPIPGTPGQVLLLSRLLLWVLPVSSPVWTMLPVALASGR